MHTSITSLHPPSLSPKRGLAFVLLSLFSVVAAHAQPAKGTIVGHIQNQASATSLKGAEVSVKGARTRVFTDTGGDYVLAEIPAGEVTVSVSYIGLATQEKSVTVPAGGRVVVNFDMAPESFAPKPRDGQAGGPIVMLEKFQVSAAAEGNARALMEQKNKISISQMVATDAFGTVASGNVAEFLKYMPGISIDPDESELRSISIGGMDPKYTGVTLDGIRLASSGGGSTGREFQFQLFSSDAIESVELDLLGGGDSPAGTIRMKTKGAFDRKGRLLSYDVFAVGHSYYPNFSRSPGGEDNYARKTNPGFNLQYSEAFFHNKIGLSLGIGHTPHYHVNNHMTLTYGNLDAALKDSGTEQPATPRPLPAISGINYKDGSNFGLANAAFAKIDYKISPLGKIAFTFNYAHRQQEFFNRGYGFGGLSATDSSLTHVKSSGTGTLGSINANYSVATASKLSDTYSGILNFDYKFGRFEFDLAAGYSRANTDYEIYNPKAPFFYNFAVALNGIDYEATRSSPRSTDWQFARLGGNDWANPAVWVPSGTTSGRDSHSQSDMGQFVTNLKWHAPTQMPLEVVLSLEGTQEKRHATPNTYYDSWTYQIPTPGIVDFISPYKVNPHMGDNISTLGLPYPDRSALYRAYAAENSYINSGGDPANWTGPVFTLTPYAKNNWLRRRLDSGTDTLEKLAAATLRVNAYPTRRLDIQAALRYDFTDQATQVMVPLTKSEMAQLGFPADADVNTPEYITAQLRNGERKATTNTYAFLMPSVAVRYKFTPNLFARAGFSTSIGRVNIDNVAGRWGLDEANATYGKLASAPNPMLKPDKFKKALAGLSYYIKGGGELSVIYTEQFWNGASNDLVYISPDGTPGDLNARIIDNLKQAYGSERVQELIDAGYTISTYSDLDKTSRKVRSLALSYNQTLPFFKKRFRVAATFSRNVSSWLRTLRPDRTASGSIYYDGRYIDARVNALWVDRYRFSNPGAYNERWYYARTTVDFEAVLKISKFFNPYIVIYNLTNAKNGWFIKNPDYVDRIDRLGTRFIIGIKGRF